MIRISGPQFERTPEQTTPAAPPESKAAWKSLRTMRSSDLREMGLEAWDAPDIDGKVLMLFPGEWYSKIPDGYEIESILGEKKRFHRGSTDDDIRFGFLAFGIRVKARNTNG